MAHDSGLDDETTAGGTPDDAFVPPDERLTMLYVELVHKTALMFGCLRNAESLSGNERDREAAERLAVEVMVLLDQIRTIWREQGGE